MKLPPVLLLLVSVLISNDKLHKVITTLALELQGQKQSFFIKVVAAMSIVDIRCRGNFEIAIHIEHNRNVWKSQKKSHLKYCQRCKLRSHYEWTKVYWKCQKWFILASFWKPEVCGQTVFTDRSFLIGQKLVESAKIERFKCNILDDFQTLCSLLKIFLLCLNI